MLNTNITSHRTYSYHVQDWRVKENLINNVLNGTGHNVLMPLEIHVTHQYKISQDIHTSNQLQA